MRHTINSGADACEIYIRESETMEINCRQGEAKSLQRTEKGVGIRALARRSYGFASIDGLSPQRVHRACERCAVTAKLGPRVQWTPARATTPQSPQPLSNERLSQLTLPKARDALLTCTGHAITLPQIESTSATMIISRHSIGIVNSEGLEVVQKLASMDVFFHVTASNGIVRESVQDVYSGSEVDQSDLLTLAVNTAVRARKLLNSKKISRLTHLPIILSPDAVARILRSSLALAVCLDIFKDSFLSRLLGKQVAPECLSLIDDGIMAGGRFSSSFDGDGVARQRTVIIENGTLRNCLSDRMEASKNKQASTGNARRGKDWDHRTTPHISHTNLVLRPGQGSLDEFVGEYQRAILLQDVNCTPNWESARLTGSIVQAFKVESGELTSCVGSGGFVIDLTKFLKNVIRVGRDVRQVFDVRSPSVVASSGTTLFPI